MTTKRILINFLSAAILLCSSVEAIAQHQQLFLLDGQTIEGTLTELREDRLLWQEVDAPGSITIPLARVDYISFPDPEQWTPLMEAFQNGNYEQAIAGFAAISSKRTPATHYPAPGNFATLSERRLLDCLRALRRWADLRAVQSNIEWEKLPVSERSEKPLFDLWADVGAESWQKVIDTADTVFEQVPSGGPEIGYARALAFKGLGREEDAIVALAETFGPYSGSNRELAKHALIEAANLMANDPLRQPELKALVHTYAAIYGDGVIWDDSTELQQQLLTLNLDLIGGPKTSKTAGADEEMVEAAGTIQARYIRIVQSGDQDHSLRIGEIEVMQGGYNIAKKGTATLSSAKKGSEAKFAIDGKTKNVTYAGTEPSKDPWFEIDMGKVMTIDSLVVWTFYVGANPKKLAPSKALKDFDVVLLNGDRKEVFAERKIASASPKHVINLAK